MKIINSEEVKERIYAVYGLREPTTTMANIMAAVDRCHAVDAVPINDFNRMKNCVNCIHNKVCLAVARRKAQKANDYSPCKYWEMEGDKK